MELFATNPEDASFLEMDDGAMIVDLVDEDMLRELACEDRLESIHRLEMRICLLESDLPPIGTMAPNLTMLRISRSNIPTVRSLGTSLRNLTALWIANCQCSSLDGIQLLPNLRELYAAFNAIDTLTPLTGHEHICVLDVEGNELGRYSSNGCDPWVETVLMPLRTCPSLRVLTLTGNIHLKCIAACLSTAHRAKTSAHSHQNESAVAQYRGDVRRWLPQLQSLDDCELDSIKTCERTRDVTAPLSRPQETVVTRGDDGDGDGDGDDEDGMLKALKEEYALLHETIRATRDVGLDDVIRERHQVFLSHARNRARTADVRAGRDENLEKLSLHCANHQALNFSSIQRDAWDRRQVASRGELELIPPLPPSTRLIRPGTAYRCTPASITPRNFSRLNTPRVGPQSLGCRNTSDYSDEVEKGQARQHGSSLTTMPAVSGSALSILRTRRSHEKTNLEDPDGEFADNARNHTNANSARELIPTKQSSTAYALRKIGTELCDVVSGVSMYETTIQTSVQDFDSDDKKVNASTAASTEADSVTLIHQEHQEKEKQSRERLRQLFVEKVKILKEERGEMLREYDHEAVEVLTFPEAWQGAESVEALFDGGGVSSL